jgi:hypothetical protein
MPRAPRAGRCAIPAPHIVTDRPWERYPSPGSITPDPDKSLRSFMAIPFMLKRCCGWYGHQLTAASISAVAATATATATATLLAYRTIGIRNQCRNSVQLGAATLPLPSWSPLARGISRRRPLDVTDRCSRCTLTSSLCRSAEAAAADHGPRRAAAARRADASGKVRRAGARLLHLGQFAHDYRATFGETASDTLARAHR